jgi:hypothetical protein
MQFCLTQTSPLYSGTVGTRAEAPGEIGLRLPFLPTSRGPKGHATAESLEPPLCLLHSPLAMVGIGGTGPQALPKRGPSRPDARLVGPVHDFPPPPRHCRSHGGVGSEGTSSPTPKSAPWASTSPYPSKRRALPSEVETAMIMATSGPGSPLGAFLRPLGPVRSKACPWTLTSPRARKPNATAAVREMGLSSSSRSGI